MTTTTERAAEPLTKRQRQVYECIVGFCETCGYGPTIREIATALGISSPNGVVCHLVVLKARGWITWSRGRSRTIRPVGGIR